MQRGEVVAWCWPNKVQEDLHSTVHLQCILCVFLDFYAFWNSKQPHLTQCIDGPLHSYDTNTVPRCHRTPCQLHRLHHTDNLSERVQVIIWYICIYIFKRILNTRLKHNVPLLSLAGILKCVATLTIQWCYVKPLQGSEKTLCERWLTLTANIILSLQQVESILTGFTFMSTCIRFTVTLSISLEKQMIRRIQDKLNNCYNIYIIVTT